MDQVTDSASKLTLAANGSNNAGYNTESAFECTCCGTANPKGTPYITIHDKPICKDCYLSTLRPQFDAALADESRYPVNYQNHEIDPLLDDLPGFSTESLLRWHERSREYLTPNPQRIYCRHFYMVHVHGAKLAASRDVCEKARKLGMETGQCLTFLGRCEKESAEINAQMTLECAECQGLTCSQCGAAVFRGHLEHSCDPANLNLKVANIDDSLVRGVDYQICPNERCMRPKGLADDSNLVVCDCHTQYCFKCGDRAPDGDCQKCASHTNSGQASPPSKRWSRMQEDEPVKDPWLEWSPEELRELMLASPPPHCRPDEGLIVLFI